MKLLNYILEYYGPKMAMTGPEKWATYGHYIAPLCSQFSNIMKYFPVGPAEQFSEKFAHFILLGV